MWFFIVCGLIAYTGKPVSASCPLELSPDRIVVRYGGSFSSTCTSLSNKTEGLGWESQYGGVNLQKGVSLVTLKIESMNAWVIEPVCFVNFFSGDQCIKNLPVTVYKKPDSVSMSRPSGDMIEGRQYAMRCDVVNVAPAKSLLVNWYKGNKMFHTEVFSDTSPSLVNKSSVLNLTAHGDDDNAQIWCEAMLNLWPQEQNPSVMRSERNQMTVLYPPVFATPANESLELEGRKKITFNCTATGNPMPQYEWQFPQGVQEAQNGNQAIMIPAFPLPGIYSCTAYNKYGRNVKYFTVTEAPRDQTTMGAILGGGLALAVVIAVVGFATVTPDGTFSFNKGSYIRGQPTSSGPV